MEIGNGIVVKKPLTCDLFAVTQQGDNVKIEDPYGVLESYVVPERFFQKALEDGIYEFCWTFDEAKDWD